VDCFYEGENMLVIHPDECIDCGSACRNARFDAIKPDTGPGLEKWLSLNAEWRKSGQYYDQKAPPPDSKEVGGEAGQTPILLTKSRRG